MRSSRRRSSGQVDHSSGGTTAGFEGATVGVRSSVDIPEPVYAESSRRAGRRRGRPEAALGFTAHPACGIPQRRSARVGASRPVQESCLLHVSPEQRKQCNNADTEDNGAMKPIVRLAPAMAMAAFVIVVHAGGVSAQTQAQTAAPAAQPPEKDPAATQ